LPLEVEYEGEEHDGSRSEYCSGDESRCFDSGIFGVADGQVLSCEIDCWDQSTDNDQSRRDLKDARHDPCPSLLRAMGEP
jgi:hypothetical protein